MTYIISQNESVHLLLGHVFITKKQILHMFFTEEKLDSVQVAFFKHACDPCFV